MPLHLAAAKATLSGMADEPVSENAPPADPQSSPRARRGRRGGRGGRRGRGRRRDQPSTEAQAEAPGEATQSDAAAPEGEARDVEAREIETVPRERRPASPEAIQKAIEQVNHIIESLRESLDEMEEVLETIEVAERQKNADEAELESLRRSLGRLRPR